MTGDPSKIWDVCVIGGGPAGTVCARRLAELGHQVTLVERQPFPRPHVGEALSPGVLPLLDAIGLRHVLADGSVASPGTLVRWETTTARLIRPQPGHNAITVDRGHFDLALLDAARAAGVRIIQPARARRPRRGPDCWEIPLTPHNRTVRARFVADASGRARALGGKTTATGARTLALHATWHGRTYDGGLTRITAGSDSWGWSAPLPDGTLRAMTFIDPDLLEGRAALEPLYRRLVSTTHLLDGYTEAAITPGSVTVCDATSYVDHASATQDTIKLGESACTLDPLSSSGVDKALQNAMTAAVTVNTLLADDGDHAAALAFYRDSQHNAVSQHATWAAGYYAEHQSYRDYSFWRRRAAAAPPSHSATPTPRPLTVDLLTRPLRLSPHASLVLTPCPVDDRVQMRRALVHPALPSPVAYVGGVELAPLLDCVAHVGSLTDLLHEWSRRLSAERAVIVARWLYGQAVLENG
jgi:flavin-dependent dehydrogenase